MVVSTAGKLPLYFLIEFGLKNDVFFSYVNFDFYVQKRKKTPGKNTRATS